MMCVSPVSVRVCVRACVSQGENGVVFYLTLDVVETNCSVLSKKDWKTCEARPTHDTPVRKHTHMHIMYTDVAFLINKIHLFHHLFLSLGSLFDSIQLACIPSLNQHVSLY